MEIDHSLAKGYIEAYYDRGLHQTLKYVLNTPKYYSGKLKEALKALPSDPANPAYPPEIVTQLYRQKEEAHDNAKAQVGPLERILDVVDREIARCRNNLATLNRDLKLIRTPRTQEHYSSTIAEYAKQYRIAVEQRKQIESTLAELKSVLAESASRKLDVERDAEKRRTRAGEVDKDRGKAAKTKERGVAKNAEGSEGPSESSENSEDENDGSVRRKTT